MIRNRPPNRNGTVLVVVLVCLGFAATVMMSALRTSVQQRRQLRNERDMVQAEWLLDAGVRVAIQKLKTDESYSGQKLSFKEGLRPGQVATIEIEVSSAESGADSRLIRIISNLKRPKNNFSIRRSHSFEFPVNESPNKSLEKPE